MAHLESIKRLINPEQWPAMGKRAYQRGDESHWDFCPNCKKGVDRLHTFVSGRTGDWMWKCNKCGNTGTIVDWYETLYGINAKEAIERIERDYAFSSLSCNPEMESRQEKKSRESPNEWQINANELIRRASDYLWSFAADAINRREYLHHRGIMDDTIKQFQLGYIPRSRRGFEDLESYTGKRYGLIIPTFENGIPTRLSVRFDNPVGARQQRYTAISGGKAKSLFNADALNEYRKNNQDVILILCEGQFDCMLLNQTISELGYSDKATAVTWGSTEYIPKSEIDYRAHFLYPQVIYIVLDYDEAGRSSALTLSKTITESRKQLQGYAVNDDVIIRYPWNDGMGTQKVDITNLFEKYGQGGLNRFVEPMMNVI